MPDDQLSATQQFKMAISAASNLRLPRADLPGAVEVVRLVGHGDASAEKLHDASGDLGMRQLVERKARGHGAEIERRASAHQRPEQVCVCFTADVLLQRDVGPRMAGRRALLGAEPPHLELPPGQALDVWP